MSRTVFAPRAQRIVPALFSRPAWLLAGALAGVAAAPTQVHAQGAALPDVKVNLPPSPSFDIKNAPIKYDGGEYSIFGLRKTMSKVLDKDVQVKAFLLQVYECPEEIRKCNDAEDKKRKQNARKRPARADAPPEPTPPSECKPCDQPHFYVGDAADTKLSRALVVADYPVKDWKTSKPRPLDAKLVTVGQQYVVTGTFAINSMTGFAASNGLIIHKRMTDLTGKSIMEGNAVLPPEAQTIELEGKPPEKMLQGQE